MAVAALVVGIRWNTFAAGGSDSSCYLLQARALAAGRTFTPEALEAPVPPEAPALHWPRSALAPMGHIPSPVREAASVGICPPGLSLAMAPFVNVTLGGVSWAFLVVPFFGALGVWLTYRLGLRLDGPLTGIAAAVLLAASPIFLYQVVQPMSDVPAMTLWVLALAQLIPDPRSLFPDPRSLSAGLAAGAAILIRPNLLPLGGVLAVYCAWRRQHAVWRFAAGVAPGVLAALFFNWRMFGSPFSTGYGDTRYLFAVDHVLPNLQRYVSWTLSSHTPVLLLAFAAPFVARGSFVCLAFALATLGCYLPYVVFDDWWYIRFLLPALPLLIVLSVSVLRAGVRRFAPAIAAPALIAVCAALSALWIGNAIDGGAFRLRALERHYVDAGNYAARLPENAVVFTVIDSGSVRFHGRRETVLWDSIAPDSLDRSIDTLRARGRRPYLLLESEEEPAFKQMFRGHSRFAALDWPPSVTIGARIKVFDPAERERFLAGARVRSERLLSPVPPAAK